LPTQKKARKAIKELSKLFGSKVGVKEALNFIINQDFSYEALNNVLLKEIGYLKKEANSLGRAPICAEIPENIAFKLWYHLKNWDNILKFANLTPLTEKKSQEARNNFMLSTASVNLMDDYEKAELTDEILMELGKICDTARSLGRCPSKEEIPKNVFRAINKLSGSWHIALARLGLPVLDKKIERQISRSILRKRRKDINTYKLKK